MKVDGDEIWPLCRLLLSTLVNIVDRVCRPLLCFSAGKSVDLADEAS